MYFEPVEIVFLAAVSLVIYIYFGYPVLLFVATKIVKPFKKNTEKVNLPSLTIFTPVYNEEGVISQKIKNTLSLSYPSNLIEVIVASDGSNDETNTIVRSYANKGVKVFINDRNEGKNAVINKFVPLTHGEIIIFTDANSMFYSDALKNIVRKFSDPRVGCVGGKLKYSRGKSLVSRGEGLYFRYENMVRKLEALQGNMVGANGAIFAIRRNLFTPIPHHVPNDFFHPLSVLKRGFYSVFEEKAIAWEKPTENPREEFNRRARIVARSIGALVETARIYGLFRGRGWFHLLSHKILRWFAFPIMLAGFFSNLFLLEKPFYLLTLIVQIFFLGFGILGFFFDILGKKAKLFYIPYYFLLINIAGVIGLYNYFRGEKVFTWKVASTTR